jgi:hypothetical protein
MSVEAFEELVVEGYLLFGDLSERVPLIVQWLGNTHTDEWRAAKASGAWPKKLTKFVQATLAAHGLDGVSDSEVSIGPGSGGGQGYKKSDDWHIVDVHANYHDRDPAAAAVAAAALPYESKYDSHSHSHCDNSDSEDLLYGSDQVPVYTPKEFVDFLNKQVNQFDVHVKAPEEVKRVLEESRQKILDLQAQVDAFEVDAVEKQSISDAVQQGHVRPVVIQKSDWMRRGMGMISVVLTIIAFVFAAIQPPTAIKSYNFATCQVEFDSIDGCEEAEQFCSAGSSVKEEDCCKGPGLLWFGYAFMILCLVIHLVSSLYSKFEKDRAVFQQRAYDAWVQDNMPVYDRFTVFNRVITQFLGRIASEESDIKLFSKPEEVERIDQALLDLQEAVHVPEENEHESSEARAERERIQKKNRKLEAARSRISTAMSKVVGDVDMGFHGLQALRVDGASDSDSDESDDDVVSGPIDMTEKFALFKVPVGRDRNLFVFYYYKGGTVVLKLVILGLLLIYTLENTSDGSCQKATGWQSLGLAFPVLLCASPFAACLHVYLGAVILFGAGVAGIATLIGGLISWFGSFANIFLGVSAVFDSIEVLF